MIIHNDITRFRHHQPYRAVDSTIDTKQYVIRGNDIKACGIVCLHYNLIFLAELHLRTNLAYKSGISSFMRAGQIPIDINLGTRTYTFKAQEDTFTFQTFGESALFPVIGCTFIESRHLFLHIIGIPRMRDGYFLPIRIPFLHGLHSFFRERPFLKLPTVIE